MQTRPGARHRGDQRETPTDCTFSAVPALWLTKSRYRQQCSDYCPSRARIQWPLSLAELPLGHGQRTGQRERVCRSIVASACTGAACRLSPSRAAVGSRWGGPSAISLAASRPEWRSRRRVESQHGRRPGAGGQSGATTASSCAAALRKAPARAASSARTAAAALNGPS